MGMSSLLSVLGVCADTQGTMADGLIGCMRISCPVMLSSGCEGQQGRRAGGGRIALAPFQPLPQCLLVACKSVSGSLSLCAKHGDRVCL